MAGPRRPYRRPRQTPQPLVPLQRPADCPPLLQQQVAPIAAARDTGVNLARMYYRYRWELAPVTWAGVTGVLGAAADASMTTGSTALVGGALLAGTHLATRRWRSRRYRAHALAAAAATGGWATAATIWGPGHEWMIAALASATAVVGVPWWLNKLVRDQIVQVRERERWAEFARQVQLVGSKLVHRKRIVDEHTGRKLGWEALVELPGGQTWRSLEARKAELESHWKLRIGAIEVHKVPERADRALLRVVERDTFAEAGELVHPALTEEWTAGSKSILDPAPMGLKETGGTATIQFATREGGISRGLTAGMAGSGKSNWINVKLAFLAACRDAVIWYGETAKAAAKAGPWLGVLDMPPADTPEAVLLMLKAAEAVIEERGRIAREQYGDDAIPPGEDIPALMIELDEVASMVDDPRHGPEILARLTRVARTGRSLLVGVDLHGQHVSAGAFGFGSASQLLSQLDIRACFRLQRADHARFVFPSHYRQIDASALPHDGSVYLSTRPDAPPELCRVYALYRPADVKAVAARLAAGPRPRLDERSAAAAARVLGDRYVKREQISIAVPTAPLQTVPTAESEHNSTDTASDERPQRVLADPPEPMTDEEAARVEAQIEATRARITAATDRAYARADATRAEWGGSGYLTATAVVDAPDEEASEDGTARDPYADLDETDRRILDALERASGWSALSANTVTANLGGGISTATVKRRLAALQQRGLVRMVGAGRAAGWVLAGDGE